MTNCREGFTLVELSIVLVIIGLLIGGILVAQSMVSTAKVNAVAMQIGQFDAGVMNFKTKYNYLPGDAPAFGGDGSGTIDRTAAYSNGINVYACEIVNFWNNIFPDLYTSSPCSAGGTQAVTNGQTKNVPSSKLGSSGSFFAVSASSGSPAYVANMTNIQNYYFILSANQVQTPTGGNYFFTPTTPDNSAVKPIDLLALDKKIDDGTANTGTVISGSLAVQAPGVGYISQTATINPGNGTPNGICSTAGTYIVANNYYGCTPLIRIGAQAGDPQ